MILVYIGKIYRYVYTSNIDCNTNFDWPPVLVHFWMNDVSLNASEIHTILASKLIFYDEVWNYKK